jgi:branched-chain amino acid aminotransferase
MKTDGGFCWLDGFFHRENETPIDSRVFHTGIVLREEVRTRGTRMAFFPEHYKQLQSRLSVLKITLPDILTAEEMHRQAVNLINKNRYFGGNNLRITIIHKPGHDSGTNHCLMECIALDHPAYVLNRKGYLVGLYDDLNIPLDRLAGMFARSNLLDFFARRYMTANRLDDCILFNQQGHIVSSIFSTIFFRIKDEIHTPPEKDGSPSSVMRDQVIRLLTAAGHPVDDKISLRALDIEKADEIILANALDGIRWVVAVDRSRYYNHTGARLITMLNEKAFGSG